MKTRGNQQAIEQIISKHGLQITEQKTSGNFTSYRLRRKSPAFRIVPAGNNYMFAGIYKDKRAWRYSFENSRVRYTIDKKAPYTTIVGNAAWFNLITELLTSGAANRVDVLGQKFETATQYLEFCENNYSFIELVESETIMNEGGLK